MFYFNASVKSFYINMFLYLPSFLRGSVFSFFSVKSLVVTDIRWKSLVVTDIWRKSLVVTDIWRKSLVVTDIWRKCIKYESNQMSCLFLLKIKIIHFPFFHFYIDIYIIYTFFQKAICQYL